jgi:1-acyl-sn-glycerol-3-phosphate acyltransferase
MRAPPSPPPKPVTKIWRPELARLPRLTPARRIFRALLGALTRLVLRVCLRATYTGLEHLPRAGPALLVINHLGDADAVVVLAALPRPGDVLGKVELQALPLVGRIMDWYGVIWLHRGRPDRRALHAALEGLAEGRVIAVAPEGRESLVGGLEPGEDGAAFLALKADVPIVPIALTGTQNALIYGNLRRLRRTPVTLTVGAPFRLERQGARRAAIQTGTHRIMTALADLLPPEYRGVYGDA